MLPVSHPGTAMAASRPALHIPFRRVMVVMFSLPVGSLCACLFLGTVLHMEQSTTTHCKVPNIVPSISAVIGGNTPERYIWRLGIALFSFPRILDSFLYHNFFSTSPGFSSVSDTSLNYLVWLLHVVQYLSLFILSYVSSTEYYEVHRNGFIGFISCSIFHMIFFLILFRRVRTPFSARDKKSYKLRVSFAVLHIFLFFLSIYFFKRHNDYCEPYSILVSCRRAVGKTWWGWYYARHSLYILFMLNSLCKFTAVYSWYGACEYLVVFTNIAFHTVQTVDFGAEYHLSLAPLSTSKNS